MRGTAPVQLAPDVCPGLSGSKRPGGYSDSHGGGKTTARDPLSGGPAKKKKRDDGYDAPSKPQHRPSDPRDPRKGGGGGGGTNKSKGPPQVKMNFVNEMLQANVEIRFVQDNPKRAGTKSYDLYEARERDRSPSHARSHHAQKYPPSFPLFRARAISLACHQQYKSARCVSEMLARGGRKVRAASAVCSHRGARLNSRRAAAAR